MDDTLGDHLLLGASDSDDRSAQRLMGLLETPAFMRRAQRLHQAFDDCRQRCATQRYGLLEGVRLHLRAWHRLNSSAPQWQARLPTADAENLAVIDAVAFQPEDRRLALGLPGRAASIWRDLARAVDRFNARWETFLFKFDCSEANNLVLEYNRHYLLEKECVFRSPKLAARGFHPQQPITLDWLLAEFPLLPALVHRF